MNVELLQHWFERMDHFNKKHMNPEKDYCKSSQFLNSQINYSLLFSKGSQLYPLLKDSTADNNLVIHVLATLPEYHRQGLGSQLLLRTLQDADKDHAKTYLQATEIGAGLYPRHGWKDVEDMVTQTPEGPVIWRCMMWEPKA